VGGASGILIRASQVQAALFRGTNSLLKTAW